VSHEQATVENIPEVDVTVWSTGHQRCRHLVIYAGGQEDKFVYRRVAIT